MNLEPIKLLDSEPDATAVEVNEYIEHLARQSGSWGLRQLDRIALTIARVARAGLEAAGELDGAQKTVVAQRLEIGRLKSKREQLQAANTELCGVLDRATASTAAKDETIESQQRQIEDLQERLDALRGQLVAERELDKRD